MNFLLKVLLIYLIVILNLIQLVFVPRCFFVYNILSITVSNYIYDFTYKLKLTVLCTFLVFFYKSA